MSYSIEKLRSLSDNEIIAEHDKSALNTSVGTNYYMQELDRRSRERYEKATFFLSVVGAVAAISAVITSIIALIK